MVLELILTLTHKSTQTDYDFHGFIGADESVDGQNTIIEGDTDDDQFVSVVRFKTAVSFQLYMHNEDTINTAFDTAIGKCRQLATDVKRLTDDDENWTAKWYYFDDGTNAFNTQTDGIGVGEDYIGKITTFGWSATGESANNRVKVTFTLARNTG